MKSWNLTTQFSKSSGSFVSNSWFSPFIAHVMFTNYIKTYRNTCAHAIIIHSRVRRLLWVDLIPTNNRSQRLVPKGLWTSNVASSIFNFLIWICKCFHVIFILLSNLHYFKMLKVSILGALSLIFLVNEPLIANTIQP